MVYSRSTEKKKKNPQIRFIKNEWKGMAIEITDSKFPGFANFGSLFWMLEYSATSDLKLFQINQALNVSFT